MDAITDALALWPGLRAGVAVAYATAAVLVLRLYQAAETSVSLPRWARWSRWPKALRLAVVLGVALVSTTLGTWLVGGLPLGAALAVGVSEGWKVAAAMVAANESTTAIGEAIYMRPLGYGSRSKVSLGRLSSVVVPVPTAERIDRIRASRV